MVKTSRSLAVLSLTSLDDPLSVRNLPSDALLLGSELIESHGFGIVSLPGLGLLSPGLQEPLSLGFQLGGACRPDFINAGMNGLPGLGDPLG